MPQMSPLTWLLLFIFFSVIFCLIFASIMYLLMMRSTKLNSKTNYQIKNYSLNTNTAPRNNH